VIRCITRVIPELFKGMSTIWHYMNPYILIYLLNYRPVGRHNVCIISLFPSAPGVDQGLPGLKRRCYVISVPMVMLEFNIVLCRPIRIWRKSCTVNIKF